MFGTEVFGTSPLGMPASHIGVPLLAPLLLIQLSANGLPGEQRVMAQEPVCLPPSMEFWVPVCSLVQSWLLQASG